MDTFQLDFLKISRNLEHFYNVTSRAVPFIFNVTFPSNAAHRAAWETHEHSKGAKLLDLL